MNHGRSLRWPLVVVAWAVLLLTAAPSWAQILDRLGGGLGGGGAFAQEEPKVSVEGRFTLAAADRPAQLFVTATMAPGWHIYSITQAPGGPLATVIKLDPSNAFRLLDGFQPLTQPDRKREGIWPDRNLVTESHPGSVTWQAPIELAPGVDPTSLLLTGQVYAQACSDACIMPQDYPFTAMLAESTPTGATGEGTILPDADDDASRPSVEPVALVKFLALAFLGGLLLNLMPCVLPVISLKLLAFIEQAGESRARILTLNAWYALGLMSVFMVLAFLAASAGLAWGQQFTLVWFKVTMIGLVFVMALSFLGVWEIPIPGFVGSGKAGELQTKEGVAGAFFKGVFATILATPCSGPFLGATFGWLLTQPPFVAYAVFGAVGLGMASPYLIVGAFPSLIRHLPRPGAWMETFKQVMGFFLLGTVVYLFSATGDAYFIPTFALLVGLWFACWLVGRIPPTARVEQKLGTWAGGVAAATLVGFLSFTLLLYEPLIPWQPYTPEALASARAEGKTVMVDFTADWCPNCKVNSRLAIERRNVLALVERNDVVPLLADWTDGSPTIKKALNDLGANSIPLLAIWPPEGEPIVLKDLVTQRQVLDALTQAGPSRQPAAAEPKG